MRNLEWLVLILCIGSNTPFATADFQWLDWQITNQTGDANAYFTPANQTPYSPSSIHVVASGTLVPGASSISYSSIQASARFQITNSAASLPITFAGDLHAVVDYLPGTQGYAHESIAISGVNTFSLSSNPVPYGTNQPFEVPISLHDVPLVDGIYTITLSAEVGFTTSPFPYNPGNASADMSLLIFNPVPEPASLSLLALGILVAGLSYRARRQRIPLRHPR